MAQTIPSKYTTVQANFDRLVNVVKPAVGEFARKAFSKTLISKQNMIAASNLLFEEEYRATAVLGHILDKIEDNQDIFEELMGIFQDIPAIYNHLPKELYLHIATCTSSPSTYTESDHSDRKRLSSTIQQDHVSNKGMSHHFRCTCGECALKKYLADRCPNAGTKPYPYLDMDKLDKASRVDLIAKLESEVEDIGFKFADLICSTRTSLNERKVSPKDLAISVLSLKAMQSTAFQKPLVSKDEDKILSAESVSDILLTLMPYMSFFNYEVLKHIINDLGSDEDRKHMESYLNSFHQFCKRNVFEVPPNVYGRASNTLESLFAVKLTDSSNDTVTVIKVSNAQRRIAKILDISPSCLYLCHIDKGCVELVFLMPRFVAEQVFPLTSSQLADLSSIGISVIIQPAIERPLQEPPHGILIEKTKLKAQDRLEPLIVEYDEEPRTVGQQHSQTCTTVDSPTPDDSSHIYTEIPEYSTKNIPSLMVELPKPMTLTSIADGGLDISDDRVSDQPMIVSCGDESTVIYWQVQFGKVVGTTEREGASCFYLIPDREYSGIFSIGYIDQPNETSDINSYVKANLNILGHNPGPLGLVPCDTQHRHTQLSLKLPTRYIHKGSVLYANSYYIKCARRRETQRSGYIAMKQELMDIHTHRSFTEQYKYITKCVHKLSENDKPDTWMQFHFEPAMDIDPILSYVAIGGVVKETQTPEKFTKTRIVSDTCSGSETVV